MQFSANFLQALGWRTPRELAPIWEILDPPLVMSDIVNDLGRCVDRVKPTASYFTE